MKIKNMFLNKLHNLLKEYDATISANCDFSRCSNNDSITIYLKDEEIADIHGLDLDAEILMDYKKE